MSVGTRLAPRRLLLLRLPLRVLPLFRARGAVAGTPVLMDLSFSRRPIVARRLAAPAARLLLLLRLLALGLLGIVAGFAGGRGAGWTIAAVPRVIHCACITARAASDVEG